MSNLTRQYENLYQDHKRLKEIVDSLLEQKDTVSKWMKNDTEQTESSLQEPCIRTNIPTRL